MSSGLALGLPVLHAKRVAACPSFSHGGETIEVGTNQGEVVAFLLWIRCAACLKFNCLCLETCQDTAQGQGIVNKGTASP